MLRQNKWLIPLILIVMVTAVVGVGYALSLPRGNELPASLIIQPASGLTAGAPIAAEEKFSLSLGFAATEEKLREMLTVTPDVDYILEGGGKQWTLSPKTPLEPNTILTMQINDKTGSPLTSYAFQTKSDLAVSSVYPSDGASYMDVNTAVEITFNHTGVDLSKGFEIQPAVSGKFETAGFKSRFLPDQPLKPGSIYRVTLKEGLSDSVGNQLKELYTFTFSTATDQEKRIGTLTAQTGDVLDVLPGEGGKVSFWTDFSAEQWKFRMDLYRFTGINSFEAALKDRFDYYKNLVGEMKPYMIDVNGLNPVQTVEELSLMEDDNGNRYAALPKGLEAGWYVMQLTAQTPENQEGQNNHDVTEVHPAQVLVQVSPVSIYSQSVNGNALFWMNDPVSGNAVKGAEISLEAVDTPFSGERQTLTLTTDEKGLAGASTGEADSTYMRIVRDGTPVYYTFLSLGKQAKTVPHRYLYRMELYTDREIYKPEESVEFWGVLAPRSTASPSVKNAYLLLETTYPTGELQRIPVTVGEDGIFRGTMTLGNLRAGGYQLKLVPENYVREEETSEYYCSKYITVQDYVKPPYVLELSTDKDIYRVNESVTFRIKGTYYDGTPLAGRKLTLDSYEAGLDQHPITLDNNGMAEYTGKLTLARMRRGRGNEDLTWAPMQTSWGVSSADENDGNLNKWSSYQVMASEYAGKISRQDDDTLKIQTSKIDTAKILRENAPVPRGYWMMDEFERLRGADASRKVSLIVTKTVLTKRQTGTQYDAVNKENVPLYDYDRTETVAEVRSLTTSAQGVVTADVAEYQNTEDTYYSYKIKFDGGIVGEVVAYGSSFVPYRPTVEQDYRFFAENDYGAKEVSREEVLSIGLYQGDKRILPTASEGDENQQGKRTAVLYTLAQDKFQLTELMNEDLTAKITVKKEYAPNVWLTGAYFDGTRVREISARNLTFNYEKDTLALTVTPDKEQYKPGDTAKVQLQVKDADGKGVKVKGVLGVVDEAVFDLAQQTVDLPAALYGQIYNDRPGAWCSHGSSPMYRNNMMTKAMADNTALEAAPEGMAFTGGGMGGGGGGDVYVRKRFDDTAAFEVFETDDQGVGNLTVKLSDLTTEWRFTCLALSSDFKSGSITSSAVTTLPYYIIPVAGDKYLTEDSLSITLRSAAEKVNAGTEVSYKVELLGSDGKTLETKTVKGDILGAAAVQFDKRAAGNYSFKVTGSWNGNQDAMMLPIQVVRGGMYAPTTKVMTMKELEQLKSEVYPVQVTFFSKEQKTAFEVMSLLHSGAAERRTELLGASFGAETYFAAFQENGNEPQVPKLLKEMQDKDGGVKALPAGTSEPMLTVKALIAMPEQLHLSSAKEYLKKAMQNTDIPLQERTVAYVGLAAAGEPVLLDMRRMLWENQLTLTEQLYLAGGCALLGDVDTPEKLLADLTSKGVLKREGELIYVETTGTLEDSLNTNEGLLFLCSAASLPERHGVARFFLERDKDRSRSTDAFPELMMLYYGLQQTPEDAALTAVYTTSAGEAVTLELKERGAVTAVFDEKGIAAGKFDRTENSKLLAAVTYDVPVTPQQNLNGIQMTKQYIPLDGDKWVRNARGYVEITVTLPETAEKGYYAVTDTVPSGMRCLPLSFFNEQGFNTYYAYEEDTGRMVSGFYYNPDEKEESDTFAVGTAPIPADFPEVINVDLQQSASASEAVSESASAPVVIPEGEPEVVVVQTPEGEPAPVPVPVPPVEEASASSESPVVAVEPKDAMTPNTSIPQSPQDKRTFKIIYYVSCPLEGTFAAQPVALTTPSGELTTSQDGTVVISGTAA